MKKTLEEIIKGLKAPFREEKIEFKVGATNQEKTMGLALAYVEARAIQDRLDKVVGFTNWKVAYKEIQGGFLCSLSLRIDGEWVAKEDGAQVTDYEAIKGGISSAFKRVASSGWGIGRYLYNIDTQWYPILKNGKSYQFKVTPSIAKSSGDETTVTTTSVVTSTRPAATVSKTTKEDAKLIKINFGKYNGKTLGEIYIKDKNYFNYIKLNGNDEKILNACRYLESH